MRQRLEDASSRARRSGHDPRTYQVTARRRVPPAVNRDVDGPSRKIRMRGGIVLTEAEGSAARKIAAVRTAAGRRADTLSATVVAGPADLASPTADAISGQNIEANGGW